MAVSIVLIRVFVEACARAGVSGEQLLKAAGFDAKRLDDGDQRVPLMEYERVQATALDLTGDEALGLHTGEQANFAGFDVMASLIAYAPTLRDGLQTHIRFNRILTDEPDLELCESSSRASLRYEFFRGSARCNRLRAELGMAGFVRLIQHFAGVDASLHGVYFEHPEPPYVAEYTRIFGGAERFDQPFTGIEFDRALLGCAPLHKDPELYAALEAQALRRLARLERARRVKEQVTDYLMTRVSGARPNMAEVARALGMSARSLRRRLTQEGATFAQAFDEALTGVAKNMLSDPEQSILGTAYALGFADSSAFHKAFKRWTGITPKQYRLGRAP